ncbi:hypothetical protein VTK73DRAFT_5145 [Phialemonium thermophilum]|uniref:Uncharacterized protein n=1 Tax=Phialemonium thermophilum TaxID=223376 RepID=A0ABR3V374_9PEZI
MDAGRADDGTGRRRSVGPGGGLAHDRLGGAERIRVGEVLVGAPGRLHGVRERLGGGGGSSSHSVRLQGRRGERERGDPQGFVDVVVLLLAGPEMLATSAREDEQSDGDQHQRHGVGADDAADLRREVGGVAQGAGREGRTVLGRRGRVPVDVEGIAAAAAATSVRQRRFGRGGPARELWAREKEDEAGEQGDDRRDIGARSHDGRDLRETGGVGGRGRMLRRPVPRSETSWSSPDRRNSRERGGWQGEKEEERRCAAGYIAAGDTEAVPRRTPGQRC